MWTPLDAFWSVKYLNFGQKLSIPTANHTFLESRHPDATKNPYRLLPLEGSQKKGISSIISMMLSTGRNKFLESMPSQNNVTF